MSLIPSNNQSFSFKCNDTLKKKKKKKGKRRKKKKNSHSKYLNSDVQFRVPTDSSDSLMNLERLKFNVLTFDKS